MRVLVTNDDGVGAPGIAALARAVMAAGHDVVVAAPVDDRSGASAAIGGMHADESIDVRPVELEGLDGVPVLAVAGPPALVVMAACLGGLGDPPDMVASGINPGLNTGRAVLHSGTVGAALTAANFGRTGLAVSLATGGRPRWETAAELAVAALDWLAGQPPPRVVNLNVPNLGMEEIKGVRQAGLAPFGVVRASVADGPGTGLQMELTGDGEPGGGDGAPHGSDTALVQEGFATVTSLTGIGTEDRPEAVSAIEGALPVRSR